jgi:hypothetical protein
MRSFLVLFCIALVVHVALGGIILAEGFLLHWLFPSLDVRTGVLLAAGIFVATVVFFFQLVRTFVPLSSFLEETEDDDEKDEGEDGPDTPSGRHISPPLERPKDRRRRGRR